MHIFDVTAALDLLGRLAGFIGTIIFADWDRAKQRGPSGIVIEVISTVSYYNAPMIRVPRCALWSGLDLLRLLSRHGVKAWDMGVTGTEIFFRVKRRQVKWAEYLLLRAGVPVISGLVEPRNTDWAAGYPPGSEPPSGWQ